MFYLRIIRGDIFILWERKEQLEKMVSDWKRERGNLAGHIKTVLITDQQVAEIEEGCVEVRTGLDTRKFEDKRRYIDSLAVRGKLAFENKEKVARPNANQESNECRLQQHRIHQVVNSPTFCQSRWQRG